ncbi:amidase [Sporosarcina sp. 179-K 3D1 HS]|uniref:amidase n=1 Tax=Sporosarcina sp. 179-K 3D1 HS TaxID=3232169 RepID=UPI00399F5037
MLNIMKERGDVELINYGTIRELKKRYENKEISPVEVTKQMLDRIHQFKDLNAFITINEEQALRQAELSEKKYALGEQIGFLEGIPISYKDNLYTDGLRTTSGSHIDESFVPDVNAGAVEILQSEGAVNLGKTNMHEFAFGITSNNPFYGPAKNPWNPEYTPGGSSGGSGAAVAASLGVASIGTDTGGSIRIPAAACGVVGLKATHDLIASSGVKNISWTLDHVGPLVKNMDDLAVMMEALTGEDYAGFLNEDIRGLRVGVPNNYLNEQMDEETAALYEKSLEQLKSLGAVLVEVDIPFTNDDLGLLTVLAVSEAGYVHDAYIDKPESRFGADVGAVLKSSRDISALQYMQALKRKEEVQEQFEELFTKVDVIVSPVTPTSSQKIEVEEVTIHEQAEDIFSAMIRYPSVFNMTGQPALSIPLGFGANELPVGLHFAAASYCEPILMRAGFAYEQNFLKEFYAKRDQMLAAAPTLS